MNADELEELLERELDLLTGEEDDDFDLTKMNFTTVAVEHQADDISIYAEIDQLVSDSNALPMVAGPLSLVDYDDEVDEPQSQLTENSMAIELERIDKVSANCDISLKDLTAEERIILEDLMQLMIESVERCAPIYVGNRDLSPMEGTPTVLDSTPLVLINDESDVILATDVQQPELQSGNDDKISSLLNDLMSADAKQAKEAIIQSAQEHDRVVWDESMRFKQELEQEKQRMEERRRKREEARLAALREKAAMNIERVVRGFCARRRARVLIEAHREAQRRLAAEREAQRRLEEQAARDAALRLELQKESSERLHMAEAEAQSRAAWAAARQREEARRAAEVRLFQAEDELATAIREVVLQARRRLEEYQRLAAVEDVEYDFGGYGSDDSELSEHSDEEAALLQQEPQKGAHAVTPSPAPAAIADQKTLVAPGAHQKPQATPAAPVAAPVPTNPPTFRPAPRAPKAVVAVDPTQGKRWGGSISSAAWGAPAEDASTNIAAETPADESSDQQAPTVARPVPYTISQLAAIEKERQSCMVATFTSTNSSSGRVDGLHTVDVDVLQSPVVSSLRHWAQWWQQHLSQPAPPSAPTPTTTAHGPVDKPPSEKAERENEAALQNSMVDLQTDPLLARELDFSVDGLTSSTFLSKFKNLTKLAINVNKISELGGLSSLKHLVSLSAKDNKLTNVAALSGLTQLRYLYLDSNRLSDLSGLSGLPQLTVLCANSNHIAEFPRLNCSSLQRLELSRNRMTSLPDGVLHGLPALNHLNLSSNQINSVSGAGLSHCALLQTLILSENQLTEVPAPLRLPALKNLRLNLNRLTTLDAWSHNPAGNQPWPLCTPSLQKLVLSDNQITTLPAMLFPCLPLLEEIDLSFNAIAERDTLRELSSCRLLTALHIQDNLLTTVPVTGAVAGASRTALSAPQMQQLCQWLLSVCPTLETVSGNRLEKAQYTEGLAQQRSRRILEHFQRTGVWLPEGADTPSTAYRHESVAERELLTILQAHHQSQNILTIRERAVKKDEVAANKTQAKRVNITPAEARGASKNADRDWDAELAAMLKAHLQQLVALAQRSDSATLGSPETVLISFRKETKQEPPAAEGPEAVVSITPGEMPSVVAAPTSNKMARPALAEEHVITLQRHFRGRRVRKRVGGALRSIRYEDSELDELLGGGDFDFDAMLDMSFLQEEEVPVAMVYGDHIRKRSRQGSRNASAGGGAGSQSAPDATTGAVRMSVDQQNWVMPADDAHSPPKGFSQPKAHSVPSMQGYGDVSRPSTGMTSMSSISANTDAPDNAAVAFGSGAPSPAGSRTNLTARSDGSESQYPDGTSIAMMTSARKSQRATAAAMAQEWGISDPKVLAAMMKRTQRLQSFAEEKQRKELDKDPMHRLEKFHKTAGRPTVGAGAVASAGGTIGNTRTSGSFGGAPKTIRGNGKRKHMPLPAWMLGGDQEGKEGDT